MDLLNTMKNMHSDLQTQPTIVVHDSAAYCGEGVGHFVFISAQFLFHHVLLAMHTYVPYSYIYKTLT